MDDLGRWMRRTLDQVAPPVDPRAVVAAVTPRGRRQWPRAVAAGAVAVVLVGGGLWLFAGDPEPVVSGDTTTTSLEETTTTAPVVLEILQPTRITCTAELPDYPCSNLIDGDPNTEWQAPDGGIGAEITFYFVEPVTIVEVGFINIRDESRFMRNARIRGFLFRTGAASSGISAELADDNGSTQRWVIDGDGVETLTLTFISAYPGQSYGELPPFVELALAELEIIGYQGLLPTEGDPTTATTVTMPVPDLPGGTWFKTNPDLGGLIVQVRDLIWDGDAFYLLTRIGFGDLIVWRSPDGIEWVEYSQIGTSGVTEGPWHLVSTGGGLVVGGRRATVPTVWIEEGGGWREVTVAPSGAIVGLVRLGETYAALGQVPPAGTELAGSGPSAVIWISSDAIAWTEAAAVEASPQSDTFPIGLATGPAGLVALAIENDAPIGASVWAMTSRDGVEWGSPERAQLDMVQLTRLSGSAQGYFAIGIGADIYMSADGVAWTPMTSSSPEFGEDLGFSDVETFGDLIVVSGNIFVDPGGEAFNYILPAVWVYLDEYALVPLGSADWFEEPGFAYDIVTAPDRLVVVGDTSTGDWALYTFVLDQP